VISHATEDLPLLTTCMSDSVEIIGERDSLAISCDLSEVHSCNHTHSGYGHEHVQSSVEDSFHPFVGIVQRRQVVWTQRIGTCIC
jgi:hypothetical protein